MSNTITPADIRAEIARHKLEHRVVAKMAGMHPSVLSRRINGKEKLSEENAAAIWKAIRKLT